MYTNSIKMKMLNNLVVNLKKRKNKKVLILMPLILSIMGFTIEIYTI